MLFQFLCIYMCDAEYWTQACVHNKQTFYHWTATSPLIF